MEVLKTQKKLKVLLTKIKIENLKNNITLNEINEKAILLSNKLESQKNAARSLADAATDSHLLNQPQVRFSGKEIQLRSNWIAKANNLKINCEASALLVERELIATMESKTASSQKFNNGKRKEEELNQNLIAAQRRVGVIKDEIVIDEISTSLTNLRSSANYERINF